MINSSDTYKFSSKSKGSLVLSDGQIDRLRQEVLDWYYVNQRALPWRRLAHEPKHMGVDPYHVWLSEIMLQQTVVETVIPYFKKFTRTWPDIGALSRASEADILSAWAGLGYYSRARNLLACAQRIVKDHGGLFPHTIAGLKALPGIGDYTAAAILAFGFNLPSTVVDGNIERIISRFFKISEPLPKSKQSIKRFAEMLTRPEGARDWPQALMDIAATLCRPRSVLCASCPLKGQCLSAFQPDANAYPIKLPRTKKSEAATTIYWVTNGSDILVHQRTDRGLLAGTLGLPHEKFHKYDNDISELKHMLNERLGDLERRQGIAFTHVFTHIRLVVSLCVIRLNNAQLYSHWPASYEVRPRSCVGSMPTLFQKIAAMAEAQEG
jgi:A/G-specific adenine glycosylase